MILQHLDEEREKPQEPADLTQTLLWPGGPTYMELRDSRLTGDSLLLADFASNGARGCGADLGCGAGILMLLLLWEQEDPSEGKHPDLHMTGFELYEPAAAAARENLRRNGLERRGEIRLCDLRNTSLTGENGKFDFVITNPPYFRQGRGDISANRGRALARSGAAAGVATSFPAQKAACEETFMRAARRLLKNGGRLYLCHRPEVLTELMTELSALRLEPKRLRFVHHAPGKPANLVLLEARAGGRPGLSVEPPLFLHDEDGLETTEYRRICHR